MPPNNDSQQITIVPFKDKYLQIFKGNSYYLLDRYKYEQTTIMMLLDLKKINTLGEQFRKYVHGVEKTEFIRLIKNEIGTNPNDLMDETNLVYGLYKFFCEIDFNGDGHMQWEEFTQFIIDTVEGENHSKCTDDDIETTKPKITKNINKYKRYEISSKLKDFYIHKTDVITAVYISRNDSLLICEYNTKKIRILNARSARLEKSFDIEHAYEEYERMNMMNKEEMKGKKKNVSHIRSKSLMERKGRKMKERFGKKEVEEKGEWNETYSVISMCASNYVVAVCLSNSVILFFSFIAEGKADLLYRIKTPSLQKRVWFLHEHNVWFSSGCKEKNEEFFYINELDVEFEIKNQDIEAYYNENHPYRDRYCTISAHRGEIYDVIEINKPFLILTACLDGIIRLININDKDYLKKWHNHNLGVKHLIYNPYIDLNGLILSSGFEYYINIYCTDLSIEEAYKGRLEGHYAPVVSCEFLGNSYMCVSVDEDANVRIWNTKLKLCMQMIPSNKKNMKVCGLLFMNKLNQILIYGNKLIFYEPKFIEEDKLDQNNKVDDAYPIKVDFNKYYQDIYVTTTRDIRIYNKNGELIKIFKKCRQNEHFENDVRIKYFIFENNYRKFYLGFSNGAVMQYNAGNGSLIKSINESEIEKDGIQTFKYDHIKEITSLFYFYQYRQYESNFLIITTALDSLINIYNENNPEETEKLRSIKGGHTVSGKRNDILCMDFSLLMCLLVTGSTNGLIVLWDFEISKIEDVCYISPSSIKGKIDVISVKFLEPYQMILASYSNGSCALWGVKTAAHNKKYLNLLRFHTFYNTSFRVELCTVICSLFINKELNDIDIHDRKYLFRKFFCNDEESIKFRQSKIVDDITGEILPEVEINKEYMNCSIDMEIIPKKYYSQGDKMKYYLYICDNKGYMKILDLKGVIRKYNLHKETQTIIRSNFNIMKKDNLNVETILNHNLQKSKELEEYINIYTNELVVYEWKAHDDGITDICKIDEPYAVITIGKDKYMRMWNDKCELIGQINVLVRQAKNISFPKKVQWKFKMDEKKILEKEIQEVVRIFEEVGVAKIEIGSKEDEEAQKIEVVEHVEDDNNVIMKPTEYHKKRFKPLEMYANEKKRKNIEGDDENKMNGSYEGLYVMEITKRIDTLFHQKTESTGMGQISDRIIEMFLKNSKSQQMQIKKSNTTKTQQHEDINISHDKGTTSCINNNIIHHANTKCNSFNRNYSLVLGNINNINIHNNNNNMNILTSGTYAPHISKTQCAVITPNITQPVSISKSSSNINQYKTKASFISSKKPIKNSNLPSYDNQLPSDSSSKILSTHSHYNNHPQSHTKSLFSSTYTTLYKRPKTNKRNIRVLNTNFRNSLYCEKLIKVNEDKNSNDLKDKMLLPIVRYQTKSNEKIAFRKGETEKLLSYEFYKNSYKNCCKVDLSKNFQNASMAVHYKNMWNYVDAYTKSMRKGKSERMGRIKINSKIGSVCCGSSNERTCDTRAVSGRERGIGKGKNKSVS